MVQSPAFPGNLMRPDARLKNARARLVAERSVPKRLGGFRYLPVKLVFIMFVSSWSNFLTFGLGI